MPTKLVNVDPSEIKEFACQTVGDSGMEVWQLKDGRFLVHLTVTGRGPWIELSAEQAVWLAAELSK